MKAPDLPLLVLAGAGLIVAGRAHENINLSLHRLGAIFGLDCLNTAMIVLGAASPGRVRAAAEQAASAAPARGRRYIARGR